MVNCVICSNTFQASVFNPHKMYCSNACKIKAFRIKNPRAKLLRMAPCPKPRKLPKMQPCPRPAPVCACGCTLPMRKRVCDPCADAKYKADRSKERAIRRARHDMHAETFSPYEVFTRDKWRCKLCGTSTPRRLRGTYEDKAPELDHIVSLADGGHHTRANTQCACRRCNIEKGSQSRGQIGLNWG